MTEYSGKTIVGGPRYKKELINERLLIPYIVVLLAAYFLFSFWICLVRLFGLFEKIFIFMLSELTLNSVYIKFCYKK